MKYQLTLLTALVLASCSKQPSTFEQIKALEQSDEIGTDEGLSKLALLHKEYGMNNNDSLAMTYLYAAGVHYYFEEQVDESKSILNTYLQRGDSGFRLKGAYLMLADIYAQQEIFDSMDLMVDGALKAGLPNNMQWNNIVRLYQAKQQSSAGSIKDYERMAMGYNAQGLDSSALAALDQAVAQYPEDSQRAELLFRSGFIAWEYLKDNEGAKLRYKAFLDEYPQHELAEQVSTILSSGMLQMSDEEYLDRVMQSAQQ